MEAGKAATGVKREARTKSLREARLTAANLAALEKSNPNDMTLRLIRGIREAWSERDEAIGSLALERADLQREAEEVRAAQEKLQEFERERALVVIHPDGFVEVYGSKYGLDVHIVQVNPLENEGEWEKKLPLCYRDLAMPGKVKGYAMLDVRPQLTDEALVNLLLYDQRRELMEAMERILKGGE